MDANACNVCHAALGPALYRSADGQSLTSLCRLHPATTEVFACRACAHLQTRAIDDVDAFYDTGYDILVDSEEEDQIYEVRDGVPVYRTAHQVRVLRERLDLSRPLDLLDYGCAKSSTIRTLCADTPSVTPWLFDVSERYVPFWQKFVEPGHWAIKDVPAAWRDRFDVVTSFFSLEHIPGVAATVRGIAALLRPGGTFYAVVPNVLANVADFVVIDHCNHFTAPSLRRLFAEAGFVDVVVDADAHRGAFVATGRRAGTAATQADVVDDTAGTLAGLATLASFWEGAAERVRAFERTLAPDAPVAIYGAGFYGAFLRASLAAPDRVACHLDNNPFLHGKPFNGRPVLPPAQLPDAIDTVLVGLNPAHARAIVAQIPALARPGLRLFFL